MKRKYEFTDQEMNLILELLLQAPYKVSAQLIQNIQLQIKASAQIDALKEKENHSER